MLQRRGKRLGFTFVETLLTVVIVGIIAGVAAKVLVAGLDIYAMVVNRNDAVQSARVSMDRMVDELLLVKSSDLIAMGDTIFSFRDADGELTAFTRVTASIGGQSVPCIYRGPDFLARDAVQFDFDYYRADGLAATTLADLRRINIDLTVETRSDAGTIHLRTDVFPRNFMYGNFE